MFTKSSRLRRVLGISLALMLVGAGVASAAPGSSLVASIEAAQAEFEAGDADGGTLEGDEGDESEAGEAGDDSAFELGDDANEIAKQNAAEAQAFTDTVKETVATHVEAIKAWTSCLATNASARGEVEGDPAEAGAFDPTEGCDDRPVLDMPHPRDFITAGDGADDDGNGPPDGVPFGNGDGEEDGDDDAGPPSWVTGGPPAGAGGNPGR